ncbi:MAG: transcription elongation factor GreA [Eubacteriales bacterium]|nr:transcription elongation factor GreA [Eubacteriales bacterium]
MAEVRLTPEGVKKYEEHLEYLKNTRRMEIAEQIKIARSFGDLSENAEYDAAKNEQAKNEYDIAQLENMLRTAIVIEEDAIDTNTVNVGTMVKVHNDLVGEDFVYHIVGSAETDPENSKISNESPVGKALIGHRAGEIVEIAAPGGSFNMQILEIKKQ